MTAGSKSHAATAGTAVADRNRSGKRSEEPNVLRYFPAIIAAYLLVYFFVGERIHWNGGLGFDGHFYGRLAADFTRVLTQRIPDYYLDRTLPSFIVWLSATALHIPLSTAQRIVDAFHIYNSILLVGSAFAWMRIAKSLRLTPEVALIGTACLFLNWTVLKEYWFFVVQTDVTAFALGIVAALCVIERRLFLLALTAFVASFAWKTVMPLTLLLILFASPASQPAWAKVPAKIVTIVSVVGASVAVAISLYVVLVRPFQLGAGAAPVDRTTLPLSLAVLAAYVFYVAGAFFSTAAAPSFRTILLAPITFFIGIWALRTIVLWAMAHFFGDGQVFMDLTTFVPALFATAVAKPAIFILAMVTSLGPGFLLVLWHLPRIMAVAAAHSYGALLIVLMTLVLALDTESRQLIFWYPLLMVFLCVALRDEAGYDRRFALVFMGGSLLLAKFYLPLNALGMETVDHGGIITDWTVLLQFPWQWLFMNLGTYMGWIGYAVNLALASGSAFAFLALRARPPLAAQASPGASD
jgi:hypothetical protein